MRRLNLGSGTAWGDPAEGWVNVDRARPAGTEAFTIKWDLNDLPWPWADDSFDQCRANHVIEHCADKLAFLEQIWRVCRHGASVLLAAPNGVSNPLFWEDPTHRTPMHPGNLEYLRPGHPWGYYTPARFVTLAVNHTPELLEWQLAVYKRDDPELAARHVAYSGLRPGENCP